jgi:hypothetical protein
LVAGDVSRRRGDYVDGKTGCSERGVKAFGWRGSWVGGRLLGLEGEQVSYCSGSGREFKVGSIDDSWGERASTGYVDGLGSVMRFVTTGATGGSGLGSAKVFGARQLVAGVVDDFIGTHPGCCVGAEMVNLSGKNHDYEQQERLQ